MQRPLSIIIWGPTAQPSPWPKCVLTARQGGSHQWWCTRRSWRSRRERGERERVGGVAYDEDEPEARLASVAPANLCSGEPILLPNTVRRVSKRQQCGLHTSGGSVGLHYQFFPVRSYAISKQEFKNSFLAGFNVSLGCAWDRYIPKPYYSTAVVIRVFISYYPPTKMPPISPTLPQKGPTLPISRKT